MFKIYTIGVYGSTEESFFNKLKQNNIELFCDIRQRRGVRGSQYKYVNSNYLQTKLEELNIRYIYKKDLAPTNEIRQKQKDVDKYNNETKRQRQKLGEVFTFEYQKQILSRYDLIGLISEFKEQGIKRAVLFCVEESAEACHRSLVAQEMSKLTNCEIINL